MKGRVGSGDLSSSSQRQDMLSFPTIPLHLQPNLSHSLSSLARLDLVRLFAFGSGFGASFLIELLLSALTFPLQTLENVDCATFRKIAFFNGADGVGVIAVIICWAESVWLSKCVAAAAREGGRVCELRA